VPGLRDALRWPKGRRRRERLTWKGDVPGDARGQSEPGGSCGTRTVSVFSTAFFPLAIPQRPARVCARSQGIRALEPRLTSMIVPVSTPGS